MSKSMDVLWTMRDGGRSFELGAGYSYTVPAGATLRISSQTELQVEIDGLTIRPIDDDVVIVNRSDDDGDAVRAA